MEQHLSWVEQDENWFLLLSWEMALFWLQARATFPWNAQGIMDFPKSLDPEPDVKMLLLLRKKCEKYHTWGSWVNVTPTLLWFCWVGLWPIKMRETDSRLWWIVMDLKGLWRNGTDCDGLERIETGWTPAWSCSRWTVSGSWRRCRDPPAPAAFCPAQQWLGAGQHCTPATRASGFFVFCRLFSSSSSLYY